MVGPRSTSESSLDRVDVVGAHPTGAAELPASALMLVRVSRKLNSPPDSRVTVRWRIGRAGPERTQSLLDR